ncbi:hypothetical protein XENTR_v10004591 [Xenopus tropicalis]|uniref:Coilin n=1 Tax=Xenopus tropicalis TaxID=8364 RepID=A0A803JNQ0_XENTR|nr:coilin isoform X1 [Xenopus tropicalis]KAE8577498.1 hypothetical protein XENTR_v10004591 [Xenopus tropicalis]
MAAPSCVRVKLLFDYPPPALPESSMLWLLLDVKRCRAVTDLASIIRQRYMGGRGGGLSLYVEDCLLPPGESILLIRDNDSIRVKWDGADTDGSREAEPCTDGAQNQVRKRHWQKSEDECASGRKAKKARRSCTPITPAGPEPGIREKKARRSCTPITPAGPEPGPRDKGSTSGSEELLEGEKKMRRGKKAKKKPKALVETPPAKRSRKRPQQTINTQRHTPSNDSSGTTSCSDQPPPPAQHKPPSSAKGQRQASARGSVSVPPRAVNGISPGKGKKPEPPISSSDTDTALGVPGIDTSVCPAPLQAPPSPIQQHSPPPERVLTKPSVSLPVCGRGMGRGRGDFSWNGQRGHWFRGRGDNNSNRGRGRGDSSQFFYKYSADTEKQQQLQEPATNVSMVIQNPRETKDYSLLPLLAAAPQVGKVIAFKEGKILRFDPATQQIEMEIISQQTRRKPGKFDIVYQTEDGEETVEYAVPQESTVMLNWNTLIEPRLLMESESQAQS